MAESYRPFSVVDDEGFKRLMKTGRPEHYLPSQSTVSRDLKRVFARSRACIAKMLQACHLGIVMSMEAEYLQEYDGDLNFQTDCWTAPNHKAYMGTTVTLEHDGSMMTFVLDVVEVARSHSGINLAAEFLNMLMEFGIEHKVNTLFAARTTY
ncbi:hypothetical protein HDZ31DRAFT_49335 [Schizophyllum fasciatum]